MRKTTVLLLAALASTAQATEVQQAQSRFVTLPKATVPVRNGADVYTWYDRLTNMVCSEYRLQNMTTALSCQPATTGPEWYIDRAKHLRN